MPRTRASSASWSGIPEAMCSMPARSTRQRAEADGTVTGFLTVVPKDHPSEIPNVTGISNGTLNEDGTWTFTRDVCTSDNICLQRVLSCTMVECPIVGETGSAIPAAEVTLCGDVGVAGGEHWMEMAESCDAQQQCHRVFRKCDLVMTYAPPIAT
jgi:hypothetical protein